jgi:DNA-binding response OmpR family regulator
MIEHADIELEPADQATNQPRSVLIIDDDRDHAQTLAWSLQSQGFETMTATAGKRGLALANAERPDAILLDLELPDVDGLEICQQLVDGVATAGIPVVIVSGQDRADVVRRARTAGCDFYLRKPYDPNVVLMVVEQAIARSRMW